MSASTSPAGGPSCGPSAGRGASRRRARTSGCAALAPALRPRSAVPEGEVLLAGPAVPVGARADDATVAGLLHRGLEVGEQTVQVVLGAGGLHLGQRGVDVVQLAPYLAELVAESLAGLVEALHRVLPGRPDRAPIMARPHPAGTAPRRRQIPGDTDGVTPRGSPAPGSPAPGGLLRPAGHALDGEPPAVVGHHRAGIGAEALVDGLGRHPGLQAGPPVVPGRASPVC